MKKFALHCNRYTVITRFFNLNFVHIQRRSYKQWTEGGGGRFKSGSFLYRKDEDKSV